MRHGVPHLQDLILVDPDDEVEIRAILAFHGDRSAGYVKCVKDETTLDRVFKYFKSSYIHLLFAYKEQEVRKRRRTRTRTRTHGGAQGALPKVAQGASLGLYGPK